MTTAESARRVDETPNHFGPELRCPGELYLLSPSLSPPFLSLSLSLDDANADCGSTWIDKDSRLTSSRREAYFDDNEIEFYAFEHPALFHALPSLSLPSSSLFLRDVLHTDESFD